MRSSGFGSGQESTVLWVVGFVVVVAVGVGMIWFGFQLGKREPEPADTQPSAAAPTVASPLSAPTVVSPIVPTIVPTITPLPVAMPTPAPVPVTPTSPPPMAVAGESGANLRGGPGINFAELGYLEPGTQVPIIGRYADWWQIEYNGAPAWVFTEIVTASNTDGVAEVLPPASPIPPPPATAAPTQPPPTQAPSDYRGLVADDFQVEGAPGPYGVGAQIWFDMWITNKTGAPVEFRSLGVAVEETGQYQQSYSYSEIAAGKQFNHRDHIIITEPGTYNLWLKIGFYDGAWFTMRGPITVIVQ